MRLKQLEVVGLKSFANRTVVDFHPGVTAIVGPNGCGKSNVVDSIRWVLGEQSARHLRGDSMEDVIFKGNERVAPASMAQVSLTFENDPVDEQQPSVDAEDLDVSTLPAHFRNLAEITVTRRYFRSGESEYFINKTPCRLKDITELFLGTGIGTRAYAIIEQGRVEQLINAKPEDRRLFIEEAAGTTLFRSRKLSAERKIERTRENLLRVNDVLSELERQIQYLHRMAKKAEQFRSVQAELRDLDLRLGAAQLRVLATAIAAEEARLAELADEDRRLLDLGEELERAAQSGRATRAEAEEGLANLREATARLSAECQSLAQRIELTRREAAERQRRIARILQESESLHQQKAAADEELAQHRTLAETLAAEIESARQVASEEEVVVRDLRETAAALSQELEALRGQAVSLASSESDLRNRLNSSIRRAEDLRRRGERLRDDQVAVDSRLAASEHAAAARRMQVAAGRAQLTSAEDEKLRKAEEVRQLAQERRQLSTRTEHLSEELTRARSQLESLRQLQQNYEGYQQGVRAVLLADRTQLNVLGVVGDVISAPAEYERALAAALGEKLQYVIVRNGVDGVGAVSFLRDNDTGRGSFIPVSPRVFPGPGGIDAPSDLVRMLDLVNCDGQFHEIAQALLADVVLVPDLDTAVSLWNQNGRRLTMVTPGGDLVDATGVVTGGSERRVEEEIVARQRVAAELASACERLESELEEHRRLGAEKEELLDAAQVSLAQLDRSAHELALRLVGAEKDLERSEASFQRGRRELEVIELESQSCRREAEQLKADTAGLEARLSEVSAAREDAAKKLEDRRAAASETSRRADEARTRLGDHRVRLAASEQRFHAATNACRRLEQQLQDLSSRAERYAGDHAAASKEIVDLDEQASSADEMLKAHQAQLDQLREQVAAAQQHLSTVVEAADSCESQLKQQREDIDRVRRSTSLSEVSLAESRMRGEHLREAAREKYEVELEAQEPFDGDPDQEQEAKARLEALRTRLQRIGEVNTGAIDELRELEERATFLRTQKDDLTRSIEDLERTIQKLNRASRTRFAETFASVNEKFQSILPRLFRGGEARLVLTDENNMLETGVDIVVKPPGKRLDTVTLLSGGEKALVAVSLIFALFLTSPTPFCILDEVDAPLDDANIGRFTGLIKEMSAHTQFIVITHNKRTMESAEVLYGVTMQEPGISKLISVATR